MFTFLFRSGANNNTIQDTTMINSSLEATDDHETLEKIDSDAQTGRNYINTEDEVKYTELKHAENRISDNKIANDKVDIGINTESYNKVC